LPPKVLIYDEGDQV